MSIETTNLQGKRALVMGVANKRSLAWAIAERLSLLGVEIVISYQHDKGKHRLNPLIESVKPVFIEQCDVSSDHELDRLFQSIATHWDHFDILIHAIAFADGAAISQRIVDVKRNDFLQSLDISVYSLIATAQRSESFMQENGGSIITLSYHGAQKVIPSYNLMGVSKAALENTVRYLAHDLGKHQIRVNAVSAGPIKTLSSSAIANINEKLECSEKFSPLKANVTTEDVAMLTSFLCGEESRRITGGIHYVDSGLNILGA